MASDRFIVSGPARWRRSFHTSVDAALTSAKRCSEQFPNSICTVSEGLPGLQHVIAECNRNECYSALGAAKRRRRTKKRRR
jgi:hypothetical protein